MIKFLAFSRTTSISMLAAATPTIPRIQRRAKLCTQGKKRIQEKSSSHHFVLLTFVELCSSSLKSMYVDNVKQTIPFLT